MEDDRFCMSALHCIISKTLQLNFLHKVRVGAVQSYKSLNDKERRLRRLLAGNKNLRGSLNLQESYSNVQSNNASYLQDEMHYHSPYLTYTNLARYGDTGGDNTTFNTNNLPCHVGANGKAYPHNRKTRIF